MNWSALTKKQQQMVVATVLLAVAQIVLMIHFLGWTKPAAERGGAAKTELYELQDKIDNARIVLMSESVIRAQLEETVGKLESLAVYAPALSDRYAWAYEYVSRCATQSGVALDNLEEAGFIPAGKENGPDQTYEISVSTRCGYSSLVEFLWRLEKNNPLLQIREVTVMAMRDLPSTHQVRVLIQWPAAVKIERGIK